MLVTEQVHILAGASGAGKSTLLLQQVEAWTQGNTGIIPALDLTPFNHITWIAADRGGEASRRTANLIIPAGKSFQLVDIVSSPSFKVEWFNNGDLTLKHALDLVAAHSQLVILDPVMPFLQGKPNDYRDMMVSLIKLGRLAASMHKTFLSTHHATKARTDFTFKRAQDAISGSSALQGYSGTQMILGTPEETGSPYAKFTVVPHEGPPSEHLLTRTTDGSFTPFIEETVSEGAIIAIDATIPEGTHSLKDLKLFLEHFNFSDATLKRHIGVLIEAGLLRKVGYNQYVRSRVN